ncbi:MAG: LysM peptidoglycan-binding domain-containing protein [Lachnospiraceae bacterium]
MEIKEPKNKRVIDEPSQDMRVYLEDYVNTYLCGEFRNCGAILTGRSQFENGGFVVYIMGAIECPALTWEQEELGISTRMWNSIYQELRVSFAKQEIVGWYMPIPEGYGREEMEKIRRMQEKYFSGADMVFFFHNKSEAEQRFYVRREGKLTRLTGFYIFYEKNPQMREYIMMKREEKQLEEDLRKEQYEQDRVTMRYREYMNNQNSRDKRKKYETRSKVNLGLAYGVCVLALAGMLVLSLGIAAGYQQVAVMDEKMTSLGESLGVELEDSKTEYQDVGAVLAQELPEKEETENDESEGEEAEEESEPEDPEEKVTEEDPEEAQQEKKEQYYIVEKGDNLAGISRKLYDTESKVDEICEKNGIDDPNEIYAGQKLLLP